MKSVFVAFLLVLSVTPVLAVDPEDWDQPPKPTPTSTDCPDGQAWDADSERCIDVDSKVFDDRDRYRAARELAYAGRLDAASLALDAMADQSSSLVLTYRGYLARQGGDWLSAERFYARALRIAPDNLQARSYLGMGLAENGDFAGARQQLREIRARGGRETWPERALLLTLRAGGLTAY